MLGVGSSRRSPTQHQLECQQPQTTLSHYWLHDNVNELNYASAMPPGIFYNAHGHPCTSRLRAICEAVREANQLAVQGLPSVLVIVLLHAVPAQVIWSLRWLLVTWKRASMCTSTPQTNCCQCGRQGVASGAPRKEVGSLHGNSPSVLFEKLHTPPFNSSSRGWSWK